VIVVSDTSPITNLATIGRLHLLRDLFKSLTIAQGVWEELHAGGASWPGARETDAAPWIDRRAPTNAALVSTLRTSLDRGESETIALAVEIGAGLVLMDERDGRHAAQALGLRIMGAVGVLIHAKRRGMIEALRPELDALRERAGFYLGAGVYARALETAGEE
jgi:predicted nucleic acid-binding protein